MWSTNLYSLLGIFELAILFVLIALDIIAIRFFLRNYIAVFIFLGTKKIDRVRLPMSFNKNGHTETQDLFFYWDHSRNRIWFRLKGWMYFFAPFVIGNWHLSSDRRTIIKEDIRLSYSLPTAFVICLISLSVLSFGMATVPPYYKSLVIPVVVGIILVGSNIVFMASRIKMASFQCLDSFTQES